MIPRYEIYRERIQSDLGGIERAGNKALDAFQAARERGSDSSLGLDAAALNLESMYTGAERLFEWVAREIDGTLPGGPSWHRDLLAQMTLAVPSVRPAVISPTTRAELEQYLRFRHLVRNLYSWDLDPAKMQELIEHLPGTMADLKKDLEHFRGFLASAARADET